MFEYLEKIDNGSLKKAHKMSYEGSVWEFIESGHIYAEVEDDFFVNMSLTKSGKEFLRFSKLTLEDIDNSYGKNSIKEWLCKPLIVEAFKFILVGVLALIGGAYSSDIKSFLSAPQSQSTVDIAPTEKPTKHINLTNQDTVNGDSP